MVVATRTIAPPGAAGGARPALPAGRSRALQGVTVALAKGRSQLRLPPAHRDGGRGGGAPLRGCRDKLRQLPASIRSWAEVSDEGSASRRCPSAPIPAVWETACAEAGNCLHNRCPFFATCAYQSSRRRLYSAQILVANHALVLSDLALRARGVQILPDYDVLVLDEAARAGGGHRGVLRARASRRSPSPASSTASARRGKRSGALRARRGGSSSLYDLLEGTRSGHARVLRRDRSSMRGKKRRAAA